MKRTLKTFSLLAILIVFATGCYYDKAEELYRLDVGSCDTSNVTYSLTIAPLMQASCNSCHSTTGASGGWITDTYAGMNVIALNGKLYGAVNQSSGFSPMPKGSGKMSECTISQIKTWVNSGSPNN
jgi:hypothetical protein